MTALIVLLKKEFRESWRSFRFLWVPLVFVLLGVSEPLTNYYMMDILKAVGNVPEGFEMLMPELSAEDIIAASAEQFQMIGIIVLIATFMGTFSRERQNGTATLLYVRPISFTVYYVSKWLMANVVAIVSVVAGFVGSAYYTVILYGQIDTSKLIAAVLSYCVWILFVMTVTVTLSAAFTTTVAAASSFIVVFVGMIVNSLIGSYWTVSPWKLAGYSMQLMKDGLDMGHFWWTFVLVLLLVALLIVIGIVTGKRNMALSKI